MCQQDSPLNKFFKVSPCIEIEDWGENLLKGGYSFKAINFKGEMVGILLNSLISRSVILFKII